LCQVDQDRRAQIIQYQGTIGCRQPALAINSEAAIAGIKRLAIGGLNLEEAIAFQRDIELAAGKFQRAFAKVAANTQASTY